MINEERNKKSLKYYYENKEYILSRMKQYNSENKIKMKQYNKEYYKRNKKKLNEKHKKYHEINKKIYYLNNKNRPFIKDEKLVIEF